MANQTKATILAELAMTHASELWHDEKLTAWVTLEENGHQEYWPLRSTTVRTWLARLAHQHLGGTPSSSSLRDALAVAEGIARFDGPQYPVFVRLGYHEDSIYLDLSDDEWRVVQINKHGWQIVVNAGVRFRRVRGMLPLPLPQAGGKVDELAKVLNVRKKDWTLLKAWLIQAIRERGPYPVLELAGEQGSAKSTASRLLRQVIDPNSAALRSEPREPRDLMIAAQNSWVMTLDNLSHLPDWLSDSLCRLATGGGFATRELYSDTDEIIFQAQRPVIINGIEVVASRGDLIDRAITVWLEPIPPRQRRTEAEINERFAAMHPSVLGALLDAVVVGLQREEEIKLEELPRMADFARWVVAAAPGLLAADEFLQAYRRTRDEAAASSLDHSSSGAFFISLADRGGFRGTVNELYARVSDRTRRVSDFPKSPRLLSAQLRRQAPALRTLGIEVIFHRERQNGQRILEIKRNDAQ